MKYVVKENAGKRSLLTFYAGWIIACVFFVTDDIFTFKRELAVIWLVLMIVVAVIANQACASRARKAAARAYELGESQGAIDAWVKVQDEIRDKGD